MSVVVDMLDHVPSYERTLRLELLAERDEPRSRSRSVRCWLADRLYQLAERVAR